MIEVQHWYNRSETQVYPVDDRATAIDDSGKFLPSGLLVDLSVSFLGVASDVVFLSSATVTDLAVAVVFSLRRLSDPPGLYRPFASFTSRKPIDEDRALPLVSLGQNSRGWITFGSAIREPYFGRFSSPSQSLISTRAVRCYEQGVSSVSLPYDTTRRIGLVDLLVTAPLTVIGDTVDIPGVGLRRAAVFSLDDSEAYATTYEAVLGPCRKRAEELNCGSPEPIRTINDVTPDCSGQITIEFVDCAIPFAVSPLTHNAVEVRCGVTPEIICRSPALPDSSGVLPNEKPPVSYPVPPSPPVPPVPPLPSPGTLPYTECFDDGAADDFSVISGSFSVVSDPTSHVASYCVQTPTQPPSLYYRSGSMAVRHLAVHTAGDSYSAPRTFITDVVSLGGARHNGGLVFGFDTLVPTDFYAAVVDIDSTSLRIVRCTLTSETTIAATVCPSLVVGQWYRLTVRLQGVLSGGRRRLLVIVADSSLVEIGRIDIPNFLGLADGLGRGGVVAFGGQSAFSFYRKEAYP